jgi:hypothetical protein
MKTVKFSEVPYGAVLFDRWYSGDWCVKTGDDTAKSDEYPMAYVIAPDCLVEVQQ